jgi:hypothetical protein
MTDGVVIKVDSFERDQLSATNKARGRSSLQVRNGAAADGVERRRLAG